MRLRTKLLWSGSIVLGVGAGIVAAMLRGPGQPISPWPPVLTPERSREVLVESCRRASAESRLLLVEFSAPWCEHCQGVAEHKEKPEVEEALEPFDTVLINIGEGHELDDLRRKLGARAIPYWTIVEPSRCSDSLSDWPRKANLFPTGSATRLVEWLRNHSS